MSERRDVSEHFGVDGEGSDGDEGRGEDDDATDGEVNTEQREKSQSNIRKCEERHVPSDLLERLEDVTVGDKVSVDDSSKESCDHSVEKNRCDVENGHNGSESREILVTVEGHCRDSSLDVSCAYRASELTSMETMKRKDSPMSDTSPAAHPQEMGMLSDPTIQAHRDDPGTAIRAMGMYPQMILRLRASIRSQGSCKS